MYHWLIHWLERHQHPASRVLHAIGIPLVVCSPVLVVAQIVARRPGLWWCAAALFILGYFLQWIGHRIEGNDMGEVVLLKKRMGMPYVAVSPRYTRRNESNV